LQTPLLPAWTRLICSRRVPWISRPLTVRWKTLDAVRAPCRPPIDRQCQSLKTPPDLTETWESPKLNSKHGCNQQSHNRPPDCRNYGDGKCSSFFLIADALWPRNRQQR